MKPRATILLTFIGVSAVIIAADGKPPLSTLLLSTITILVASAGANGLTNYLDCGIDAIMRRTRNRALPSKRINPPRKVLPLNISLVLIGLALAWYLHPLAFVTDLVGTSAAIVWRKRATCVFPQGMLASCAPILIGWFAVAPTFSWVIVLLCALIALWLPLHVWSVMLANREDYIKAGVDYFPVNREPHEAVKVLLIFSLALAVAAVLLYTVAGFTLIYLAVAGIMSIIMIYASMKLVLSSASANAWKLYKLSSFPYLGIIFLTMSLDIWFFQPLLRNSTI